MTSVAKSHTVEFKDKKRKKGYKEKKRSKRTAQYDSGSEEEEERTKLQKLDISGKEAKDKDTKMTEVYEGANFEKESSDEEGERPESEEEADDEGESKRKAKKDAKEKEKEKSSFANAMQQILNSDIGDKNVPILSKNKVLTKIIDRQKARETEQKAIAQQKQIIISKYHLKPDVATNKDEEIKLRKIATRGAVSTAQATQKTEEKQKESKTITVGGQKKQVSEIASSAFLDLLKEKGKQTAATTKKTAEEPKKQVKKVIKKEIKREVKKEIKQEEIEYESE